jgi:hypothetical protein
LSDGEIANVAAFVLTLEPAPVPTPAEPSPGPLNAPWSWVLLGAVVLAVIVVVVRYYRRA